MRHTHLVVRVRPAEPALPDEPVDARELPVEKPALPAIEFGEQPEPLALLGCDPARKSDERACKLACGECGRWNRQVMNLGKCHVIPPMGTDTIQGEGTSNAIKHMFDYPGNPTANE